MSYEEPRKRKLREMNKHNSEDTNLRLTSDEPFFH